MSSPSSPISTKLCCLAIVALTLWLGGFGCAFCCATGLTKACCLDEFGASVQEYESAIGATSSKTVRAEHSCCQRSECEESDPRTSVISQPPGLKGCTLLPNQALSLADLSKVTDDQFVIPETSELPFALDNVTHNAPYIIPPSPLNRGGTYLRCCVFLI